MNCVSVHQVNISSVQFSCSVVSDSLWAHEQQQARPPCPSPTPGVYPNPCPLSWWCHPTISSSVIPFSSCPQSFPASVQFSCSVVSNSQASLSITNSRSSLKCMSIESVMPSSHLILCRPLLLPQSLPASESFPMSQLFAWGGQSTGVSAIASSGSFQMSQLFTSGGQSIGVSANIKLVQFLLITAKA